MSDAFYKQAFYKMLLWKCSNEHIDGKTFSHAPWREGDDVFATDGKMAVAIRSSKCFLPFYHDQTKVAPVFHPVGKLFGHMDFFAKDWKTLGNVFMRINLGKDSEGDDVRDFFHPYELTPGVWVDSGRLYWFSLIPEVEYQVRKAIDGRETVFLKWADGVGAISCLGPKSIYPTTAEGKEVPK